MSDSIQVAIKVRPLIKREKDENLQIQWAVVDNVIVPIDPEKKRGENGFQFDHIFDPEKTNNDVFETVVKPIVDAAVNGFNGTVFAYGQTSSGKTYTMLGTESELGVIPMAVERIFYSISETTGREFLLRVSYLEIYNEKVNDLLDSGGTDLKLREDQNGLVQVLKSKEEIASSPDVIMAIMKKGDKNRRIGETDMNERSSRSHTIFRITIESRIVSSDSDGAIQVSQLNLVDLAGSERARQTNATGERFKEGTHINMSLSTLGLVIKQLSESSDSNKYVNFRDSKLTRLLQASLGGNAMTTIICAVTPAAFEETQCTLSFASRAKSVKNKPQLNEVMSDAALLKRYKKQLSKLHEELEKLKNEKGIAEVQEMESKLQEKEQKLQETDRMNQMLEERIQLLKSGIISAGSAIKDDTNTKIARAKRRRTWAGDRALNSRFSLCTRNLPTIKEISCTSPDSKLESVGKKNNIRSRKSIIQTVDLNDESFETAFTDFELELIKVAIEREEESENVTIVDSIDEKICLSKKKPKSECHVKFHDDVEIHRLSNGSIWSEGSSPVRESLSLGSNNGENSASPGTPKSVLRERLSYITEEYNALQEFTTLERQMLSAQKEDFESPTEKIFMQKQFNDMLDRLQKYSTYQTELEEQLTLCMNCINGLTSRATDILELWNPTLFSEEAGEIDVFNELKRLQEILVNLKNEENNIEKPLTSLEKKLTDDYNECSLELEQVRAQKELLSKENTEIKKKLVDESNKLKSTDNIVNILRTDTDCLMEKLLQKNNELSKLKERVVELERLNTEVEKSICVPSLDISVKKENESESNKTTMDSEISQDRSSEILRLNEIIQEKNLEIIKYRQFEEEIKLENEHLQQSLVSIVKAEQKSTECQTEISDIENKNENSSMINKSEDKDLENFKLSKIIEDNTINIMKHQQLEMEMKQKIEKLQQCLDSINKIEKISQECQTDINLDCEKKDDLLFDQTEEISRLTKIIEERTIEISNYKQTEEQMMEEINRLQNVEIVEKTSQESQTDSQNRKEHTDADSDSEESRISKVEYVLQEKTIEISKYVQNEEMMANEIKHLQICLENAVINIVKISQESQTEEIYNETLQKDVIIGLNEDKSNEISGLMEIIQLKSADIERYKQSEEEMKKKIEELQECVDNMIKIEKVSVDSQTDVLECQTTDSNLEGSTEMSILSNIVQEKTLDIEKCKQIEEEMKTEMTQLVHCLESIQKVEQVSKESKECQTAIFVKEIHEVDNNQKIDIKTNKQNDQLQNYLDNIGEFNETSTKYESESVLAHQPTESDSYQAKDYENFEQPDAIRKIILEIKNYKLMEKHIRKEIEQLQQSLERLQNVAQITAENQIQNISVTYERDITGIDLGNENDDCRLKKLIGEIRNEIVQCEQIEEKAENENEKLQSYLEPISEQVAQGCQTNLGFDNEQQNIDMNIEKDNEISKLTQLVEEKALEIIRYKQWEEEIRNENERLQKLINDTPKVQKLTQEIQTEINYENYDNEKILLELEMSNQIKAYQEEIETLKQYLDISREKISISEKLMTKVDLLNSELTDKLKEIEELKSMNSVLKDGIDEKTNDISKLQQNFDIKIQELEEKINIIVLERNELTDKIESIYSSKLTESFEKEAENLRVIVDKLKEENSILRKRIELFETEGSKVNLSVHESMNFSTALLKSNSVMVADNRNHSVKVEKLEEQMQSTSFVATEKNENVPSENKPADKTKVEPSVSASTESKEPVAYNDNKSFVKPLNKNYDVETSSIFANYTYFDNMEVSQSFAQDFTGLITEIDESKDTSNISMKIDNSQLISAVNNESSKNVTVLAISKDVIKSEYVQSESPTAMVNEPLSMEELDKIKVDLEKENLQLRLDLDKKIKEKEEIQKVIKEFKQNLGELQQTIFVLTSENMDMSKQLTEARENNNHVVTALQNEIDSLATRLTSITEEKTSLKSELTLIIEELENMRATTPVMTDDEMRYKVHEYQEKIKSLNDENIELSTNLMDKIEELEKVKESKVHSYDHECTYKERSEALIEKVQCLEKENIDLSSDLTEQIYECDKLRETVDVLKQQMEAYSNQQSPETSNKDDTEFFKQENVRLTDELIELRSKLTQLSRENANLLSNLALNNSDEHNESACSSRDKPLDGSSRALETSQSDGSSNDSNSISSLNRRVKYLQEQVEHLTLLNKKLGELKLTNCSQCAHLKELNESRRQLKVEVKSLNQKLGDLQKKFEQKCADTEFLRMKANEDFNASLTFMDSTLNGTVYDGINVTVIEEKVQNLHSELEELKENHNKLSNQYKEKCNELEKLQLDNNSPAEKKEMKRQKSDSSRKSSARIQTLQKDLDHLSGDLQEIKKHNSSVSTTLNKFRTEQNDLMQQIESLKLLNEELKQECSAAQGNTVNYEEKIKLLEEELATLYKRIEAASATEKEIQAHKLEIEVQLESLLKEKLELADSLRNSEENFRKEIDNCHLKIQSHEKENSDLRNELQKLDDIVQRLKKKNDNYIEETLKEEIDTAKSRIIKEMSSLTNLSENECKALSKKSVTDIFVSFLNTILSKETEIIKKLQKDFVKSKQKLEEEKQQCIDAEKRANAWSKTVETDLEKLQNDFTEQEHKNRRLRDEANRLEEYLKEVQYENQQLHTKIANMEDDLNSLHHELEKKSKTNVDRDSATTAAQEKEKLAKVMEEEWENRLRCEKEDRKREVQDLNEQLDSYKSINDDFKHTVEGLGLEIDHLKNTIEMKTKEYATAIYKIEELQREVEHMEEINQLLKHENLEKNKHVEDITGLLKIKCDLLTEYKTKVETMKPEYESLQAQIAERKTCIDKYKEDIHNLKLENKKQADILQDKLSEEEIKSAGLNKQLTELKNKNTALSSTIEEFKDRCAELERENSNLQRKVRNSTSKIRVESEMQELQDENRSLKNHLEGSYNRIKELQESKSQVQRELAEAQGKNELFEQELNTTKIALDSLREKYNNVNLQKLREKYEVLLREKNTIILEIEEKKMLIANKDQKLVEYSIEMDTLKKQKETLDKEIENIKKEKYLLESKITDLVGENEKLNEKIVYSNIEKDDAYKFLIDEKNKVSLELDDCRKQVIELSSKNMELNEEMDEMVSHIHSQESEIAELQDRLITGSSNGGLEKIKALEEENEKLKIDVRVTEVNRIKLEKEIVRLNTDKEQLLRRIEDLNSKIAELEAKHSSRNSSKSNSPTAQKGRRRHRRSDLYNQNRNLDFESDSREVTDTESPSITPTPPKIIEEDCRTCNELRKSIREMSLDLVSRNNKITMLEVQLQAENFPYQIKCNELQENLLSLKTRNSELKLEIKKLQRALMEDSSRECQMCRHRKLNKRDQCIQVIPENKICLTGMSSGIVEDHLRLEKMEKERNWMKDLCRSRARKIKELEQRLRESQGLNNSLNNSLKVSC